MQSRLYFHPDRNRHPQLVTPTLTPPAENSPVEGLEDINGVKWLDIPSLFSS
jgi:hypothetical protein